MEKKQNENEETLSSLLGGIINGGIQVIDLTMTLDQRTPTIVLPPEHGQSWPFRLEVISKYDERGPATYWNNMSCGEHTGTHFDAPIHWISGKDLPNNATDTLPPDLFIAHACRRFVRAGARCNAFQRWDRQAAGSACGTRAHAILRAHCCCCAHFQSMRARQDKTTQGCTRQDKS